VSGQRSWHLAAYALGRIDDATFDAQPSRNGVTALRAVARALAAEASDDPDRIIAAWNAYLDLPRHRRIIYYHLPEAALERLASWRTGRNP
jgi:hypothetical protein